MDAKVTQGIDFIDPSPQAAANGGWMAKYKVKFETCPIGKSFTIQLDEVKLSTLRPNVSEFNKKFNKKFRVIQHEACYEIYRKG